MDYKTLRNIIDKWYKRGKSKPENEGRWGGTFHSYSLRTYHGKKNITKAILFVDTGSADGNRAVRELEDRLKETGWEFEREYGGHIHWKIILKRR